MTVYPSYYPKFACTAGRCRHSCCIGWEIDVDEDTYDYYKSVKGKVGERLRAALSDENSFHFILGEGERCPFLNRDNLCDLILSLGEDALCEICREHPRFYNLLSADTEVGLGLCCEEAARLILTESEPMILIGQATAQNPWEEECLLWRERVFGILKDRSLPIFERLDRLLKLSTRALPTLSSTRDTLLTLEIMTPEWKDLILRYRPNDGVAFAQYMAPRESEYEQVAAYFAYRYLVTAYDKEDLLKKTALIVWACRLLFSLGSFLYGETGEFSLDSQIELVRLFSVEIEYDPDNLDAIVQLL